jgi:protocatechuate 3,4-dioxygenase beta subunit
MSRFWIASLFLLAIAAQDILVSFPGGRVVSGQASAKAEMAQSHDAKAPTAREISRPKNQPSAPGGAATGPQRTRTLDVRIVNSKTDRPEPGVTIRVLIGGGFQGHTDADGRFTISYAERQSSGLVFDIEKPGFIPLQVAWDNHAGSAPVEIPREYTIKLEPGSAIGGIVQDEQGQPIAGADVRVSLPTSGRARAGEPRILANLNHQTKTDPAGRWRCDEASAQFHFVSLSITHPDFVAEPRQRNVSSFIRSARELSALRAQNFVTVLKEGVTIQGLVRDSDGQPTKGALVAVASSPIGRSTATDADGRFELAHLAAGENQLVIRAQGHPQTTQQVIVAPDMGTVEIALQAGRTISGKVVDHRNQPVPGAYISFDPGGFAREDFVPPMTASDGGGHFQLEIPDDPGSLVANLQTFKATRRLLPSDRDITIKLCTRPVIIRGEVTDSESGQPIPSFVVVKRGLMMGRTPKTDGRYEIEWPNSALSGTLQIGIEAKGYETSRFRTVPSPADHDEVAMDFRLKRAAPLVVVIRAPDGAPLAGAEIGLSSPSDDPQDRLDFDINQAHLVPNTDQYTPMRTDAAGRITFPAREDQFLMLVVHPRGSAIRRKEQLVGKARMPIDVVLEPWGRIDGTLRVGEKLGVNEQVSVRSLATHEMQEMMVRQHLETRTDNQGQFAFEQVLPGMMMLSYSLNSTSGRQIPMSPIPAVEVKPGRTTRLELGRTGRPITGRVAIPEAIKAPSGSYLWGSIANSPQPPKPLEMLTIQERRQWTLEEQKSSRSYGLAFQPDGSFRAEDVPPGRYMVEAILIGPDRRDQGQASRSLGTVHHTIAVPERPGYTPEPYDVGLLPMEPEHRLDVGQLARDFPATTLDGKPIRLKDFRGKYLLIIFSSQTFRSDVSLAESRNLRALHKMLGNVRRFAMLGITYDLDVDRPKTLVAQRGWDWLNARVSWDVWDKLLDEYALPRFGSVWLLGPDGKVLARDLRGDAIKRAATLVLRAK